MLEIGHQIMEFAPRRGEVKADWKASSARVVKGMSSGVAANIFSASVRVPVEKLFSKNIIFELKALSRDTKKFFINWFLTYLMEYWDARESRKEQLNHVVMIDEAHHILLKRTLEGSEPVTDSMFREIRKHGVGVVYLDQSPSEISTTVLGNTNTTFVMNLKSTDIQIARQAVSLDYQKSNFITWLKEGEAIVRLQFRHPHPFLVRFKLIDIDKAAVTDADLEARQKGMAATVSDIDIKRMFEEGIKQLSDSTRKEKEKLGGPEALLLMQVASRPYLGRMERYGELGLPPRKGQRIIESLIERGLVASRWLMGERAPRGDVLQLTEEGRKALRQLGWAAKSQKANESIEHSYVKNHVAEFLRTYGWEAFVERRVGGHYPDVHAEKQGFSMVVEVEKGESKFWENILKNLEAGHGLVVSLPLRRELQEKINRKAATLPIEERARVKVMIQKEFYAWLPDFSPRPSEA
jgi:DNA-binding MarR family transcriptional regulator